MQQCRIKIKHFLVLFLVGALFLFGAKQSKAFQLSNNAEISLITCAPGNGAATVYGHSAIRVRDVLAGYDIAFNYGIYDFDAPNFLYRFASGETDYLLAAYRFDAFVNSYKRSKRSVFEQVLELTPAEKQKIVDFLIWNAEPENRVYRYNFFFDNCATRVRDVIANNVEGGLAFEEEKQSHKTLRQLVEDYHGKLLWLTFGIDFIVSSESDREASFWEEMLLPDYLMNHFAGALKKTGGVPLVKQSNIIFKAPELPFKSLKIISPFVVFFILTLVIASLSFLQFRRGGMKIRFDYWIYGFNGIVGIVLAWFVLFSEHPAMSPNYNLLWASPLNFLFAIALFVKKWRVQLRYYHLFVTLCLFLFVCSSAFLPQHFHPVFYLLVIMVLSRSLLHSLFIFRKVYP